MTKTKQEAIEDMKRFFPRGSTVYTICRHVAKSGMLAAYSLVGFVDGSDVHPNYSASIVTGRRLKDYNGHAAIVVRGCGYDRAESIVESLAVELYGDARALTKRSL